MTNLLEPRMISLDDYFLNRDETPLDETGDYDFESLYALDLDKFNSDLSSLLRGEEVELPYYNFDANTAETRSLCPTGLSCLSRAFTVSIPNLRRPYRRK